MTLLEKTIAAVQPLNEEYMQKMKARLDNLIKPLGSLGMLEKIATQLAGIMETEQPEIHKKAVILMGGDHGVVEEGVSAFPRHVTAIMMEQFAKGVAGINVLARHVGADVFPVDMGVADPYNPEGIIVRKIRPGTANMTKGPAMSREEAVKAIETGIEIAGELIDRGYNLLATGDMGIGNTTPSSAILAVLGNYSPATVTGAGTGLGKEGLERKTKAIAKAIEVNRPDPSDPLDVLAKVGGLEIAGLAGVILAGAARRIPVIVDGFISSAAALVAARLCPQAVNYMIPSHRSEERAHTLMLKAIGLKPMLHMEMRLGEGTGAVLAMSLVEAATKVPREMATFQDIGLA